MRRRTRLKSGASVHVCGMPGSLVTWHFDWSISSRLTYQNVNQACQRCKQTSDLKMYEVKLWNCLHFEIIQTLNSGGICTFFWRWYQKENMYLSRLIHLYHCTAVDWFGRLDWTGGASKYTFIGSSFYDTVGPIIMRLGPLRGHFSLKSISPSLTQS